MSQCTCKCNVCEESVDSLEEVQKPKFEPHNIRHNRRGVYAFKGQEQEDVVNLLRQANKEERERVQTYRRPEEPDRKPKLSFDSEAGGWGMPNLKREEMPSLKRESMQKFNVDNDDDDFDSPKSIEEVEDQSMFMLQKLAGLTPSDLQLEDFQKAKCVKDKVVTVLGQKYGQMRFSWTSDPESFMEQFLLVNDAKTKISISPLVEIYQAVSKISDEADALATTCQVVVSRIASLFE